MDKKEMLGLRSQTGKERKKDVENIVASAALDGYEVVGSMTKIQLRMIEEFSGDPADLKQALVEGFKE